MKKFFTLLAMSLVLLSCTKQEVYEHETTSVITIYLNSQTITKAALTNDPKLVENTINNVTVVVAKADGTIKTLKEFTSPSKSVSMRVANLSTTDERISELSKAGALIAAEIDRLQRTKK